MPTVLRPRTVRRADRAGRAGRVVVLITTLFVAMAACAPQPTALEKYCDVVQQSEAAFDPFSTPGAITDPTVLRTALTDQVTTSNALADVAPDAVRADAVLVRQNLIKLTNALAGQRFDSARIEGDPVVAALLADTRFQDARRRLQDFNGTHCV